MDDARAAMMTMGIEAVIEIRICFNILWGSAFNGLRLWNFGCAWHENRTRQIPRLRCSIKLKSNHILYEHKSNRSGGSHHNGCLYTEHAAE